MGPVITTEPVVRIVITFAKEGSARYIGHLDLVRHFQRAARRSALPLACSQGFNPHPRLVFASPLAVGATGREELAGLDLYQYVEPEEVAARLNRALPEGVRVTGAFAAEPRRGTFGVVIESHWEIGLACPAEAGEAGLKAAVGSLMASGEAIVSTRDGRERNIRSRIKSLSVESYSGTEATLSVILIQESDEGARPQDVVRALEQTVGPLEVTSLVRRRIVCPSFDTGANPRTLTAQQASRKRAAGGQSRDERG